MSSSHNDEHLTGTTESATPATAPPAPTRRNIQPFLVETMHGPLALAHNGNWSMPALRDELLTCGFGLTATSDTEVMT